MIDPSLIPVTHVEWLKCVRIIRSNYPPIDLFEDIADPKDWELILSAEEKTNPRVAETVGNLSLVPVERRVNGYGASYLMAPFTHVSTDRPSRFSNGSYGVLYAANSFRVALAETIHHHENFMRRTKEPAGWASQFREITFHLSADLHDIRDAEKYTSLLAPVSYTESQKTAAALRQHDSNGIVYPSVRQTGGECVGLFHPDLTASRPAQGRHLSYHWNGSRVDFYRDEANLSVFEIQHHP